MAFCFKEKGPRFLGVNRLPGAACQLAVNVELIRSAHEILVDYAVVCPLSGLFQISSALTDGEKMSTI
nr:hypothetical protein [Brevibacillus centrosporus]